MLRKWDSSRGIQRDDIYRKLSLGRKEQLFGRIAYQNFVDGNYFIRQETLAGQISTFLEQLPDTDDSEIPHGGVILRAIEAQHGVLIERAHGIYSFLHLTFQEYFTARSIVQGATRRSIEQLLRSHMTDPRWREVFLLVFSMSDEASVYFDTFLAVLRELISQDRSCRQLIRWVNHKTSATKINPAHARIAAIGIALLFAREQIGDVLVGDNSELEEAMELVGVSRVDGRDLFSIAEASGVALDTSDWSKNWVLGPSSLERLSTYLRANRLYLDCLQLALVNRRQELYGKILFMPSDDGP